MIPSGPNAAVTFNASSESYYAVEVSSSTTAEGWYLLRLVDLTPAPTPIPTLPEPRRPRPLRHSRPTHPHKTWAVGRIFR